MEQQEIVGTLTIAADGFGLLHNADFPAPQDGVYVAIRTIRQYRLVTGDRIDGTFRWPRDNERYPSLQTIGRINGDAATLERARRS